LENEINNTSTNAYDLGGINKTRKVTGARKVAILLITLGADLSAEIIKSLPEASIQKIGTEISNITTVGTRERREVLQEFIERNKGNDVILEGGMNFARNLLNGALGSQRATKILEGIKYDTQTRLFMAARKADPQQILACIQGESAQTIAIILSHLQPEKAAAVLIEIPEDIKHEVSLKIGGTSTISPAIIKAIDEAVTAKLSKLGQRDLEKSGGVESLVEILGNVDRKTEKSILKYIEENDADLAAEVKANMFVFDDIAKLESSVIQRVLKEVNVRDLSLALKGASPDVSEVIFKNQSQRAAQALREEIELLGKTKVSQVEEAQQNIVNVIRRLEDAGEITLSRGSQDEFI
jgi:flagellar motor switch protein FliG